MSGPEPSAPSTSELTTLAVQMGCWAAEHIAGTRAASVSTKRHGADLVTPLDGQIEQHVRNAVAEAFPGHRFRGEEAGESGPAAAGLTWYCDPIDGTTNYANGVGWCSFSLACWDAGGPLIGVVADPFRGELFVGERGRGARRFALDDRFRPEPGGTTLVAYRGATLHGAVVMMEWLAHLPWPGMVGTIAALAAQECTVRIMGSSALSIVQVAAGRAAGCYIGAYDPIDDSAAALIAAEAGAVVSGGESGTDPAAGLLVAGALVARALREARVS